jgi:hypothetical protein
MIRKRALLTFITKTTKTPIRLKVSILKEVMTRTSRKVNARHMSLAKEKTPIRLMNKKKSHKLGIEG